MDKKLIVAFAAVAIGLLLYPPTLYCISGDCLNLGHRTLWATPHGVVGDYKVDLVRLAIYELAVVIAAGVAYFIHKK